MSQDFKRKSLIIFLMSITSIALFRSKKRQQNHLKKYHDAYNNHLMFQRNLKGNNLYRGSEAATLAFLRYLPSFICKPTTPTTVNHQQLRQYSHFQANFKDTGINKAHQY